MVKVNLILERAKSILKKNDVALLPHQIEAVKWIIKRERIKDNKGNSKKGPFGGIIADEMGLGKTLEIISVVISNIKSMTLIIVPANLINQWCNEFKKFAPEFKIYINEVPKRIDNKEHFVVISSYIKSIRKPEIVNEQWDRIILDEGHYIRNPRGKINKNMNKFNGTIKWVLTGTPIQNYTSDIISILKFIGLKDIYFDNIEPFISKYVLRRTKKSLDFRLPDIEIKNINVDHSSLYEKVFYKRVERNIFKKYNFHRLELILRLRQASIYPQLVYDGYTKKKKVKSIKWKYSNSKLNTIIDTIIKNPNEKPLIFCFFKKEIEYIKEKLESNNISFEIISGDVTMNDRQKIIESSKDYKVLVLQMMAGSTGLNLQDFNAVYFSGPHWNPTHEEQAIARVYRIGQKNKVIVRKYILRNTIEEHIVRIQQRKNDMINNILNVNKD